MRAISKDSPIDHRRRRATLVEKCATWLKGNGLPESRAEYLANFIERNAERWAEDIQRPGV
jgi:hypothetical protein